MLKGPTDKQVSTLRQNQNLPPFSVDNCGNVDKDPRIQQMLLQHT